MAFFQRSFSERGGKAEISRMRFYWGIALGGGYAFILYSLLYIFREMFRLFSVTFTQEWDMWLFSGTEVRFYNFYFGLLAALCGMYVAVAFWGGSLYLRKSLYGWQRKAILYNILLFGGFFLCWFSRLIVVYGMYMGKYRMHYAFSFYPDYVWVLLLLAVVLFVQCWSPVWRRFGRVSYRWTGCMLLAVLAVAFGLSRIDVIDYHKLNRIVLASNVPHIYGLRLPESSYTEHRFWGQRDDIYLIRDQKEGGAYWMMAWGIKARVEDFQSFLRALRATPKGSGWNPARIMWRIHANRDTEMRYLDLVRANLFEIGVPRVLFSVLPKEREYDERYYFGYAVDDQFLKSVANAGQGSILLDYSPEKGYRIEGVEVEESCVEKLLKEKREGTGKSFSFSYSPETTLQEYLDVLGHVRNAVPAIAPGHR